MGRLKDLTGQRYGNLTALRPTEKRSGSAVVWECQCDCGNITYASRDHLLRGSTKSCGCQRNKITRKKPKDLTGQRFGKLIALRATDKRSGSAVVWECQCDCGNITYVARNHLLSGGTKSCGCQISESSRKNAKDLTGQRFGKLVALRPTEKRKNFFVVWECQCDCGNTAYVTSAALIHGNTKSCGCLLNSARAINNRAGKNSTTNHKGITVYKGKYMASITLYGNKKYLGTFSVLEKAVAIRERAIEMLADQDYFLRWTEKAKSDPEWAKDNPVDIKLKRNGTDDYSISLVPEL